MDFQDQIKALAKRVDTLQDQIQTEEATKTSFIMPFFSMLGYDVFNPLEFVPEYTADVGIKKGEKVDYTILDDQGKPTVIVECKWNGEKLDKHASQLFRYFSTTEAKFGILTNGIEYQFYTDLDSANVMDDKPFFTFNILNIKDQDILDLKKFHKSNFNLEEVFSSAEDLKYSNAIKSLLKSQLDTPSDNFTNYVLSEVYDGRKTQYMLDKFKPVVKKAFNQLINDLLSDKINAVINAPTDTPVAEVEVEEVAEAVKKVKEVNTTQEELDGYAIVKAILHDIITPDRIQYKDTLSYFGILLDGKVTKWICRLKVEGKNKTVTFPTDEVIAIDNVNDLFQYSEKIKESALRYM